MIKGMEVMDVMDVMKAGPACQGADFAAMQTGHCPSPMPFPHKWNCSPPEGLIP